MAIMLVLASCSKDDKTKILQTIPSDASVVTLVNLEKLNEDLGNSQKSDGKVELGKQFATALDNMGPQGTQLKKMLEDNEMGLRYSVAASFNDDGNMIMTFYVDDQDLFIKGMEKEDGSKYEKAKSGIWFNQAHNTAILNNQVWFTSGSEQLNTLKIAKYAKLKKDKSFLSVDYSSKMIDSDADVCFFGNLNAIFDDLGSEAMTYKMASSLLFDNAAYLAGFISFEKGKAVGSLQVLDKNYNPSPLAVASQEIDMQKLNSFPGKGNFFFALNINPQMVSQLLSQYGSILAVSLHVDTDKLDALKKIDGTIVASFDISTVTTGRPNFGVMISFADPLAAQTASSIAGEIVGSSAQVQVINNMLYISAGVPEGSPISAVASKFKGTYGGIVYDGSSISSPELSSTVGFMPEMSFLLKKEDKGVRIDAEIKSKPDQNFLISFLEMSALPVPSGVDPGIDIDDSDTSSIYDDEDEELIEEMTETN